MFKRLSLLMLALGFVTVAVEARANPASAAMSAGDRIVAIDVLLEPDKTMTAAAEAVNVRLRQDFPAGYELDAMHAPHVTLLQRFVRWKDLDAVTRAVARVVAAEPPAAITMRATGLDYVMWGGVAVTALTVERSPDLMRLHRRVVEAVAPYAVDGGTAAAFANADANAETIGWVASFVPKSSGTAYQPHVTAGVASEDFAKRLKTESFEPVTFKARDVAVYQLGNFGTAAKKLWPR